MRNMSHHLDILTVLDITLYTDLNSSPLSHDSNF